MARVLGLDLGAYSVKAVVLDSTTRAYHIRAFHELPRPEGGGDATLIASLAELVKGLGHIDSIAVAMPGLGIATHWLTFPFTDAKRLEATIPFEIESQLPFELSEAVFGYQLTPSPKGSASEILVGVVRKQDVRQLLEMLSSAGIDPRWVAHPALTYQYLFNNPALFPTVAPSQVGALIDIGHERTSIAIGRVPEGIHFARTFAGGGKDLTNALVNEFKASPAEVAQWKEQSAALGTFASGPDAQKASDALARALQPITRELRQSIKAASARSRLDMEYAYLSGATAQLPGLPELLGKDLGVPVQVLSIKGQEDGTSVELAPRAMQAFSVALGLHLPNARAQRLNFRRGEFAFKGDFDYLRDKLPRLFAFAAAILILFVGSGFMRNALLAKRDRAVDAMLCEVTQKVLGQCERNYDRALNMLQGKESPAAAIPKLSATNILAEFTQRIPQDIPITFDRLTVNLDRIEARGQTDSSKQIDRITSALKGFKCFREVREGKVEKTRDGLKVDFPLDVQVECPDEGRPPQG